MGAKLPKELRVNNVGLNNCSSQCFYTTQWRCPYLAYLVYRWILAFYTVGAFIYMVVVMQQVHIKHPEQSHTPMAYLTSWAYLTLVCHYVVSAVITSFCNTNLKFETEFPDFQNPDIQLKSFKVTLNDTMTALDERIIHYDNAGSLNSATECNCQGFFEKYRGSKYLRDEHQDTITSDTGASQSVNQGECPPTEETGQLAEETGHLAEETGQLAEETGHLAEETGHLAEETGHLAEETGQLAEETGQLAEETGHLAEETGQLAEETGQLAEETGHLAEETGHLAEETGHLAEETGQLAEETGHLAEETGHLAEETGHLAEETGQLAEETGHLAEETGHLAEETGQLAEETGQLAEETVQLDQGFHVVTNISNYGRISGHLKVDAETKLESFETNGTESTNRADDDPLNISMVKNQSYSEDTGSPRDNLSRLIVPGQSNVAIEPQDSADEVDGVNDNRYTCKTKISNRCVLDRQQELKTDEKMYHVLPWYCKLSWVLGNISFPFSFVVTTVYFSFVYKESFRDIFNDVNTHILNVVFSILDSFISARPTRFLHLVYSIGFGLVYLLFSVVYWAVDHRNIIYPGLTDWNNPGVAVAVGGAIALLLVIFHGINFCMYKVRLRILHKFCERQRD